MNVWIVLHNYAADDVDTDAVFSTEAAAEAHVAARNANSDRERFWVSGPLIVDDPTS